MENEKYKLIFDVNKKSNIIKILGEEFVRNNKNKGKIIYNNKIYPLQELFQFKNNMNNSLKIKMILSKDCYNKSCMFKDCSSLIHIKFKNKIYNRDDILFNCQNNLYNGQTKNKETNNNNNNVFNYEKDFFSYNTYQNENEQFSKSLNNLNKDYNWNTKISIMNEIFSNCSSLKSLPDISKWVTTNVIDMNKLFYNCRSLSFFQTYLNGIPLMLLI